MKRSAVVLILLLTVCTLWAQEFRVLVYPQNADIERYINTWFPRVSTRVSWAGSILERESQASLNSDRKALSEAWSSEDRQKIEKAQETLDKGTKAEFTSLTVDVKTLNSGIDIGQLGLETADSRLIEYLCLESDADLVIIPLSEEIGEFHYLTIDVWSPLTARTERVYMRIVQNSDSFSDDCVASLATYFLTEEELNNFSIGVPRRNGVYIEGFDLTSDTPATVLLNGIEAGQTPLRLGRVEIPSLVRLTAPGYADSVINIDGLVNSAHVSMKPAWMDDGAFYNKARDGFYRNFAYTLGAFGLKAAARSVAFESTFAANAADMLTSGILVVSLVNLAGSLFDYFKAADYLSQ